MQIEQKNGGYLIYAIVNGYLESRFYVGYNKQEAIEQFKIDTKLKRKPREKKRGYIKL